MNAVWKKAAALAASGCLIGVLISVAMCLFNSAPVTAAALWPGAVYGAVAMAGSVIYEIEEWSVTRSTILHFLLIIIGYTVTGLLAGWFSLSDPFYWISVTVMIVIYIIIWVARYNAYKRQVQEMNAELKEWRKARRPE